MAPEQSATFAISISTFLQARHFQKEAHADLLMKTVFRYREQRKFQLHGFAIMPEHVHLLITPAVGQTLPKSVQLIKGGYSFAARTLTLKEIWHSGYHEHRIRDVSDYDHQLRYIANNPRAARLPDDYLYVHTHEQHDDCLDPCPEWLAR
jgi:putative transposase